MKLLLLTLFVLTATVTSHSIGQANPVCNSKKCQQVANTLYSYIDESVDPCDDFYLFACGNFKKIWPLNGNPSVDAIQLLADGNNDRMSDLLDNPDLENHNSKVIRKIKRSYDECMRLDGNFITNLKDKLVKSMLRHREKLIELKNSNRSKPFIPIKIQTVESIHESVNVLAQRDICRIQIIYDYEYAFARLYIDKYMDKKSTKVVRDIINSIHQSLLSDIIVAKANKKETKRYKRNLKQLTKKIAYPDWILDDKELDAEYAEDLKNSGDSARIRKEHEKFDMSVLEVNAMYQYGPGKNEISK